MTANHIKECFEELDIEYSDDIDRDLLEMGIDSIVFLRLIISLEQKLDVDFMNGELDFNNFNTVRKLIAFIDKQKAPTAVAEEVAAV